MSTGAVKDNQSCPYCKSKIADGKELEKIVKQYEREVSLRTNGLAREQEHKHKEMIREIKSQQRLETQKLRALAKEQQGMLRDSLLAEARKREDASKKILLKEKKDNQQRFRDLRDAYDRESLHMQKEKESSFNIQLKEIIQNYGSLATGHQKELERLKKTQDDNESVLRKKENEISRLKVELAKSSSKLALKDMTVQVHERNAVIEKLNARIQELENRLGIPQAAQPANETRGARKPLSEDEQKEKLKEYMRAIIEITRSQQAEKKRSEANHQDEEKPITGASDSKADKILGWFL